MYGPLYRLHGKTVVVVGLGGSGRPAARLALKLDAKVRILERNPDVVEKDFAEEMQAAGAEIITGPHKQEHFAAADMIVSSPGIPVAKLRVLFPQDVEVISELELASRLVEEPILAITGTNGKTTTATLAAHILEHAGRHVFLGGNIGTPLSEYVLSGDRVDVLVLEASSFQLQNCTSFRPHVGIMLNFSADHLDYHQSMDEYFQAKMQLFARQTPEDRALFPEEMRETIEAGEYTKARVGFFRPQDRFQNELMRAPHQQANMEAAYQGCRIFDVDEETAAEAVGYFAPLEHRTEIVADVGGVLFVNDSKATTVDALRAALVGMDRPVRLLAGGVFKGGDLPGLRPLLQEKVCEAALFGAGRDVFEQAWEGAVPLRWFPTLKEAVQAVYKNCEPGEAVLLSPATASFDLYKDYKARGEDFKALVKELQ